MALTTYTALYEAVQEAIFAILQGAQTHSIKDRSYTLADLDTLREMEKQYRPLAQQEQRGASGIRVRQVTPIG
jgi:hypothetical protein